MAVLKRGDKPETLKLDVARRFAQSFIIAWNMICSHYREFLSFSWLPSVVAGLIVGAWLAVKSDNVFLAVDIKEFLLDIVAGALIMFVISFMRNRQLLFLQKEDVGETVSEIFKCYKQCLKRATKTFVPLLIAWIVVFTLSYLLVGYKVVGYVTLPGIILSLILIFSAFGLVQSYLENGNLGVFKGILKGFKLNGRYFGGFCVLFVISLGILLFVSLILFFGEFVMLLLYKNQSNGMFLEEDVALPWFAGFLKYLFMFVPVFAITILQCVWSLPQQVHVKSVMFKYNSRKNKNTETGDEDAASNA